MTNLDNRKQVKWVFYDFDQTITKIHLYHRLNGERLNALSKLDDDELLRVFGGQERVNRLHKHFEQIVNSSVTIVIISYGYTEVIEKALERMKFDKYWKDCKIIGSNSQELKRVHNAKEKVIQKYREEKNLDKDEVLFVDDDKRNIINAQHSNVCLTVQVTDKGMTFDDMDVIEEYCKPIKINSKNNNKSTTHKESWRDKYVINDKDIPKKFKQIFSNDEIEEEIYKEVIPDDSNTEEELTLGNPPMKKNFKRINK